MDNSLNEEVKNNLDENSRLQPDAMNVPNSNRSADSQRQLEQSPKKSRKSEVEDLKVDVSQEAEDPQVPIVQESLVGRKLSDLTTRKVILIVLAMLLSAPFFIVTTFI